MRKLALALVIVALVLIPFGGPAHGRDRPFGAADLISMKWEPSAMEKDLAGGAGQSEPGGQFSVSQIEQFRCASGGDPTAAVDISCNTTQYNQDWNPDNEIAVAVDPENPDHVVAGSNDYFYRFNNRTGARQALVPTGFFTSFDGGASWIDGQIPMRSGNGAGDPSPAFDAAHDVVLMAQLENQGGNGSAFVTQGDVSVSRSSDGGVTWTEPTTVFQGHGAAIGPANQAVFYDKEWITVDNNPDLAVLRPRVPDDITLPERRPRLVCREPDLVQLLGRRWAVVVASEGDLRLAPELHVPDDRHGNRL